jgi:Tfp pilus assembly protein PilO
MTALGLRAAVNGSRGRSGSLWKSRAALFAALGLLLLANLAVLVVYRAFYDVRLASLEETRRRLEQRRDGARAVVARSRETERRLEELKKGLDEFYGDVLGTRRERLATLVEDVDAITRKAGFAPSTITYAEDSVPGADRMTISFQVEGRYADIKKLLHAFETSPRFLVPERVQVALDENVPDVLRVSLAVSHYFRLDGIRPVKRPPRPAPRPTPAAAPAAVKSMGIPE